MDHQLIRVDPCEGKAIKEGMKMKREKRVKQIKTGGLVLTILMGLLFHELYKATRITLLGVISPVNESKWEHWKMAYSPMVLVGMAEYVLLKRNTKLQTTNYVFALAGGILIFEITTFGLIELYEILYDHSELWVHVSTFLLGGILGHSGKYFIMKNTKPSAKWNVIGGSILLAQFIAFAYFTFDPPRIEYFKDSITHTFGIYFD